MALSLFQGKNFSLDLEKAWSRHGYHNHWKCENSSGVLSAQDRECLPVCPFSQQAAQVGVQGSVQLPLYHTLSWCRLASKLTNLCWNLKENIPENIPTTSSQNLNGVFSIKKSASDCRSIHSVSSAFHIYILILPLTWKGKSGILFLKQACFHLKREICTYAVSISTIPDFMGSFFFSDLATV